MIRQALSDALGKLSAALNQSRMPGPSRDSGAHRGTVKGWEPRRTSSDAEATRERALSMARAADLYANDFSAHSAVDAIATNAVGTGLIPQSRIPHKLLGITKAQALEVKEQMEWNWYAWSREADACGSRHFEDLQFLGIKTLLRLGELLHLPVMEAPTPANNRTFSLAVQPLSPERLRTPEDRNLDPSIREGVQLSPTGKPLGYWIAAPKPSAFASSGAGGLGAALSSADFRYIPAGIGHRPGVFHLFRHDEDEQVRGVSALSTGMKLFRNLTDALDYELYAQILAASFPVFISLSEGESALDEEMRARRGIERDKGEFHFCDDSCSITICIY